jgi:hypothetical protein
MMKRREFLKKAYSVPTLIVLGQMIPETVEARHGHGHGCWSCPWPVSNEQTINDDSDFDTGVDTSTDTGSDLEVLESNYN